MKWRSAFFVIFLLHVFSCNNKSEQKKFKIGFSQCTMFDDWRKAMVNEMSRELVFHDDIELVLMDAEGDNDKQVSQIRQLVKDNIDLLIVSPNEAEPITPVIDEIYKKGIPIIILDRRTNSTSYTAYVGADNQYIGRAVGKYIVNLLDRKGKIIEIRGLRGSTPFIDRDKGFKEVISTNPGIQVSEIEGDWGNKRDAEAAFIKLLKEDNNYDIVFAHNDIMALAAYKAYKGLNPVKPLEFIGVDGLAGPDGGMENVANGVLKATALYPTGGDKAIQVASDILRNRSFERENLLKTTIIDSTNVYVMQMQADKILSQQKDILRQQAKNLDQIEIYHSQRTLIYILLVGLVILIVLSAIALVSWRDKVEINKKLQYHSDEISRQRDTIAMMAQKAEVAIQEKLKFFTNISHEFKTPLTLILGPVEAILSKRSDVQSRENAVLIKRNAIRLLRLVNQLMDFRKIEEKKMQVHASELDVIQFVRDVMAAFDDVAKKRKMHFTLKSELRELRVFFDADMLDKVIFNLLSNAFKFTPDKGSIQLTVSVDNESRNALIFVEDNGEGMSRESVEHAFDRFYTGQRMGGTGLGLSLSKEFMELHCGDLVLTSEKGKGTRFCVVLPLGSEHFDPKQIIAVAPDAVKITHDTVMEDHEKVGAHSDEFEEDHEYTILIIEDNKELRNFLKTQLCPLYNIEEAADGKEGMRLAYEVVPDVIITDVMMPGKDGFQITKILKEDLRTSHIPVIILTAKGAIEQRITGLQVGADDYITKPFDFEFLSEKIKALIKLRETLKEHYSRDIKINPQPLASGALDRKFINDFKALVEKNISNVDFNVNDIGPELGMSRVQIYRKVKALIGYSVNDYIIHARLKKAQYLLVNTDKTISEISAEVGFSTPNYFSTTFKTKLNISPKEFKSSQNTSN